MRSLARLYLRQFAGAESDMRLALDLNRYDAESVEQLGYLLTLRGHALEAVGWIDRTIRLNPIYPEFYHYDRGLALYVLSEYTQAIEALERPVSRPPWVEFRLAAAYAQVENADGVRASLLRARAKDPGYDAVAHTQHELAFEHQSDIDHLTEGIKKALALSN